MGKITLYYAIVSQPSRSVLLVGKALGLDFDLKSVNLFNAEHLTPEFVKMNPQHTIPMINDNGVVVYDSHAIAAYLADKYGKDDKLYPRDLAKRAEVNARLHFDTGFLFARLRFLYEPILYFGSGEVPQDKVEYLQKCWPLMEAFLEKTNYVCGDEMTIADLCCVATISSVGHYAPIDPEKYPKLLAWLKRMAELPYYNEANGIGAEMLIQSVDDSLVKNKAKL
ncbi:glutathione S-transferase 1-like [Bradysia coprophila]|uniref:glutathione S-transferase 1-like n=1 Tax=Bradysia coprophila TaxID=38358 RepID=UPI00187DA28E|nr:glutathione S-transferase 1-like [Bradysia coprophila]